MLQGGRPESGALGVAQRRRASALEGRWPVVFLSGVCGRVQDDCVSGPIYGLRASLCPLMISRGHSAVTWL